MDSFELESLDISPTLSIETVRDYLERNNGKVLQSQLVNHFRSELSNPSTKVCARREFKDILNVLTAARVENGEKFIVLTHKHNNGNQDHFQTSLIARKSNRFRRSSTQELNRNKHLTNSLKIPSITYRVHIRTRLQVPYIRIRPISMKDLEVLKIYSV